ncbi:putative importin subunit beta-1 [Apostichopus japonicus]|uniref:Putative importin subunit beta-1 n=1 Tax=Stichopus japonicus TaxID=307972 RepID=A0A2G8LKY6_STIJA|nr:putative importin subunit beta-1 [Apostichopus japonicus]
MDLIQILEKTVAPDKSELDSAQAFLETAAQTDLPGFLIALSQALAAVANSPVARVAAGLQLKNHLTSKDPLVRLHHQQQWMKLPDEVRGTVKAAVLSALGTETSRPSQAAQCVAGIACAEIPADKWPELIDQLVKNVSELGERTPEAYDNIKEASLEAIGYICQDIEQEYIQIHSNKILTAIVQGVRKEEENNRVKLAATNALLNSLEFTKSNFEKEIERHYIMQVTCEATQCKDNQVKVAALQCLVKIVSLYYEHMESYMGPALFAISVEAMKSPVDEIALQGIEFWSNICDEEMDLTIEMQEAEETGKQPDHVSRFYAKGALQYLVPILLETLKKQDENDDEDEWNPCKAAGVCLMLLANCTENDIVPHVVPFITSNITVEDWHSRDAAVMAFGSILEGPDLEALQSLVVEAVPILIRLLTDKSVVVRDTVAWTIGRICELLPQAIFNSDHFKALINSLLESLQAEPRVAANVCWAFSSLAENAFEFAQEKEGEEDPSTYILSEHFDNIVTKLLEATYREDAHQANLRSAAYEALMEMIKNSATDCYGTVQATTLVILQRINQILQMESRVQTAMDRMQYNDLQSLLCATLQSVLRKMKREDALKISDDVMRALLQMFQSSVGAAGGGVQEDAFVAVGTLVEVLGPEFLKYMQHFEQVLYSGLQNHEESSVCLAAVGLVGDLCRALNTQILPMCHNIMHFLFSNLENNNVNRTIKPQILSVFGDIALAIGPGFKPFLELAMPVLKQASEAEVDRSDYDNIEYLNDLREGCLEAYTGIVQGLKGDSEKPVSPEVKILLPHVEYIVKFMEHIAGDDDHTDSNVATCSGLIGDLCCAFGEQIIKLFETPKIGQLLSEGKMSKTKKTRTLATWAVKEIRKLSNTIPQ